MIAKERKKRSKETKESSERKDSSRMRPLSPLKGIGAFKQLRSVKQPHSLKSVLNQPALESSISSNARYNNYKVATVTSIGSLSERRDENVLLTRNGYTLLRQIGSGGFATVHIVSNKNLPGVKLACKMFVFNDINRSWIDNCLRNEMIIMMKVQHPNIVPSYDAFKTRTKAYIIMKLARNGNIEEYIARHGGKASEPRAKCWFSGLVSAVAYLHMKSVAHRDLKLENFLLDERLNAMLSDFGLAVFSKIPIKVFERSTLCGTLLYMAPEVLLVNSYGPYDAFKADLYSFGICLFECLHGKKPFEGNYDIALNELITRQLKSDYKIDPSLSKNSQDLLKTLLEPLASKRQRTSQVAKHAWFQ